MQDLTAGSSPSLQASPQDWTSDDHSSVGHQPKIGRCTLEGLRAMHLDVALQNPHPGTRLHSGQLQPSTQREADEWMTLKIKQFP